jgi:predicted acylesterase/phospholipase RssA
MSDTAISRGALLRGATALGALAAGTVPQARPAAATAPRRALVLSGGGSWGAYEAGVIAGLVETGQLDAYDVVCGTSIGTLNAAMVATGQGAQARELWATLAKLDILRAKREFAAIDQSGMTPARAIAALRFLYGAVRGKVTGLIDPAPMRGLIAKYVTAPGGGIRPFTRPMLWTATNLATACGTGFMREATAALPGRSLPTLADLAPLDNLPAPVSLVDDVSLAAALQASTAIPGAFDPVTLPRRSGVYVDGGVLNNSPLDLAQMAGATEIDLVILTRPVSGQRAFSNALAILEESYDIMRQRILNDAILLALLQSDAAAGPAIRAAVAKSPLQEQAPLYFREVLRPKHGPATIRTIIPSAELLGSGFGATDQTQLDRNIDLGYNDFMRTGFRPITQPLGHCAG